MAASVRAPAARARASRAPLAALGLLTAIAFVLRVVGMDQSLYGDEDFTYYIVSDNSLSGVWDDVFHTSITPPLHYVLAWISLQFGGDDTVLVRLPSLIFGTALVPLIYVLGRRIGGVRVGLLAAVVITLSPFAIWYSDEARNYATMMFLVTLSTLALLEALDGGRRWWVVYAVSGCAALWCHYTAVFVLAGGVAWALWTHRDSWREVALANAAVAVGYLPWLPGFFEQRQNEGGVDVIEKYALVTLRTVFEVPAQTLVGHPFYDTGKLPGKLGWLFVLILLALAVAIAVRNRPKAPSLTRFLQSEPGLITALALATPVGLLLYAAAGTSLYIPRNVSASVPALVLLVALLIAALTSAVPRRIGAVAVTALIALLAVMTVRSMGDDYRRPPYREAARYVDDVAEPGDPVLEAPPPVGGAKRLPERTLDRYFQREHPLYPAAAGAPAWRRLTDGRSVYSVAPSVLSATGYSNRLRREHGASAGLVRRFRELGGPDGRAVLREERPFAGIFGITVSRFAGVVDGRVRRSRGERVLSWTFGKRIDVAPGVALGAVEEVSPPGRPFLISGWAVDATSRRPADWVLLFYRDRLFAVSPGGVPRPDIARRYGRQALLSGFFRTPSQAPADRAAITAFAVVGDRASELPLPG